MKVTCITHIDEKSEEYLAWVGQSSESFKEHLQSTLEHAKESHNLSKMRMKADRDKRDENEMIKERLLQEARLKKEKQYEEEAQSLRKNVNEKLESLLKESLNWKKKYQQADDNQLKCENEVFKFCEKFYFKAEKLCNAEREIRKLKRKVTWLSNQEGNQLNEIEELQELEELYSKVSQTKKESLEWKRMYRDSAGNLKTSEKESMKWRKLYQEYQERDGFKWRCIFHQSKDKQHKTGNDMLKEIEELSNQVRRSKKGSQKWRTLYQKSINELKRVEDDSYKWCNMVLRSTGSMERSEEEMRLLIDELRIINYKLDGEYPPDISEQQNTQVRLDTTSFNNRSNRKE